VRTPKFLVYSEAEGIVYMRIVGEEVTRKFMDLLEAITAARRLSDGQSQLVAYGPSGGVAFEVVV
jgi:hypothetical protein